MVTTTMTGADERIGSAVTVQLGFEPDLVES